MLPFKEESNEIDHKPQTAFQYSAHVVAAAARVRVTTATASPNYLLVTIY